MNYLSGKTLKFVEVAIWLGKLWRLNRSFGKEIWRMGDVEIVRCRGLEVTKANVIWLLRIVCKLKAVEERKKHNSFLFLFTFFFSFCGKGKDLLHSCGRTKNNTVMCHSVRFQEEAERTIGLWSGSGHCSRSHLTLAPPTCPLFGRSRA